MSHSNSRPPPPPIKTERNPRTHSLPIPPLPPNSDSPQSSLRSPAVNSPSTYPPQEDFSGSALWPTRGSSVGQTALGNRIVPADNLGSSGSEPRFPSLLEVYRDFIDTQTPTTSTQF